MLKSMMSSPLSMTSDCVQDVSAAVCYILYISIVKFRGAQNVLVGYSGEDQERFGTQPVWSVVFRSADLLAVLLSVAPTASLSSRRENYPLTTTSAPSHS